MTDFTDDEIIEILNEYGPIVKKIARSACYSSASIDFTDLCQVGDLAVIRAIKSYEPTYGSSMRSFVARLVRQDIYNEAARFLGVFTVDRRVTSLAAKASKLHEKGKTDDEIADILSDAGQRNFDAEHVRDLRIAYDRRQHADVKPDDSIEEIFPEEDTIREILNKCIHSSTEHIILEQRLLGDSSVKEVALLLGLSQKQVYELENELKSRIKSAIEDATE